MAIAETINSRLVHINLAIQVDSREQITHIRMRERPFIGELNLDTDPDNLSLLIAVGDVMGVSQPLTVSRISCIGQVSILWLDSGHWLVLPVSGSQLSVKQALSDSFGQQIQFQTEDNLLQASLSETAINQLQANDKNTTPADPGKTAHQNHLLQNGISILSPADHQEYDILVRDHCAERLWQWLSHSEQTPTNRA
ncbi:MAG: sarcosine oxidase subunit gamma family protein [Pontibacterium sp.]